MDASMKTSNRQVAQERTTELTNKEREEMARRAILIFEHLADRKVRAGEGEAILAGFTRREDGDTNWLGLSWAAELAKCGHSITMDEHGRKQITKVLKG
jgi:hypothetical protein